MARVRASVAIVDPDAARALWYDTRRWPAFVDGFRTLVSDDGDVVIWDSGPHHQGRTREVRTADGAEIETEQLRGSRRDTFAGGLLTVELDYELKRSNPVQAFFVRRAIRDSLERTLRRFEIELAA
jgi:hypothetical protein